MEKSTIIIQLQTVLPFYLTQKVSWTTTIFTRSKPSLVNKVPKSQGLLFEKATLFKPIKFRFFQKCRINAGFSKNVLIMKVFSKMSH